MPAIWQSSERPISVRTVQVDGIRHAVLSPDDPLVNPRLRRRSRASKSNNYSTEYRQTESRLDRLNSCFTNLHVVVNNDLAESKSSPRILRKLSAPPCPRLSASSKFAGIESSSSDDDRGRKDDHRTLKQGFDVFITKPIFKHEVYGRKTLESEVESRSNAAELKQTEGTSDSFLNPLFERVLQWLDLSGRSQGCEFGGDSVENSPREEKRKWSPIKRRGSRCKRDSIGEKVQNCKLEKECVERDENKLLQTRLPKIKNTREESRDDNDGPADLLSRVSGCTETPLKPDEKDAENEIETREKVSAIWSPPRRLQLHIVMPNLIRKENMSSQESLIND